MDSTAVLTDDMWYFNGSYYNPGDSVNITVIPGTSEYVVYVYEGDNKKICDEP